MLACILSIFVTVFTTVRTATDFCLKYGYGNLICVNRDTCSSLPPCPVGIQTLYPTNKLNIF